MSAPSILFLVTEDWYFCSHRLPMARAALQAGYRVMVATRVNRHASCIEGEGFELLPIGMKRRGGGLLGEVRSIIELVGLYRRHRPDLVHHVAMKPVVYGTLAARLAGVGAVVNALAGLGYLFTSSRTHARLLKRLVQFCLSLLLRHPSVRIVVQNPDDRRMLSEATGIAEEEMIIIPGSGVDTTRFSCRAEPPEGELLISMVSRMLKDKGVFELVEAVRRLRQRKPHGWRLVLAGTPDHENPSSIPEETLRNWGREGLLEWLGEVKDVPGLLQKTSIAVLPSHREGLPMSLLEAASACCCLVATDVPGCREVVQHEKTGLLTPLGDATALAGALERLLENRRERILFGKTARERVMGLYSKEVVVERLLALYRERLSRVVS
ncbi:MAG: glycosyltransferase family 4 protein [Magnetococcales bacterium]|nr:glycosyltransferase family 4 protein [Magnetococcales bacterium]